MATNLAELFVKLSVDTGDLSRKMTAAQRAFTDLGNRVQEVGQKLTLGLTLPLTALGTLSVRSATQLDSLRRGLTAVAGSSEEAERQLARLAEVAKLPGLGFREAIQGSIRLQAAGLSAELAEDALRGFGNALATVGAGKAELDAVSRALSQIASKGKISAEEINQIAEVVPQIRVVMEQAFGTSNSELLQKMGIDAETFVRKVTDELLKLEQVTGGPANAFENLSDAVFRATSALGTQLLPAVLPLVEGLARMMERVREISPETVKWGIAIAAVAAVAGPLLIVIGSLTTAIAAISTAIGIGLLPLIVAGGPLLIGLGLLSAAFLKNKLDALEAKTELERYEDSIQSFQRTVATANKESLEALRDQLRLLVNAATVGISGPPTVENIQRFNPATGALEILPPVDPQVLRGWQQSLGLIEDQLAKLNAEGDEIADGFDDAAAAADNLARSLGKVTEELKRAKVAQVEALGAMGKPALGMAVPGVPSGLDLTLKNAGGKVAQAGGGDVASVLGVLKGQALAAAGSLGPLALAAVAVKFAFDNISGGFRTALAPTFERLAAPLRDIGATLGESLQPLFEALVKPLDAIARLFSVLMGILEPLTAIFQANFIRPMEKIGQVLRLVVVAFSYVEQALGEFVKGLGIFIDNLVPDWLSHAGKGLVEMGQEMIDGAKAARDFSDSVKKAALETSNVPIVFARALRTFQASTGGGGGGGSVPGVGGGWSGGSPGNGPTPFRPLQITGPVTVVANNPEEFARQMENYGARVEWRAGYNPLAAIG